MILFIKKFSHTCIHTYVYTMDIYVQLLYKREWLFNEKYIINIDICDKNNYIKKYSLSLCILSWKRTRKKLICISMTDRRLCGLSVSSSWSNRINRFFAYQITINLVCLEKKHVIWTYVTMDKQKTKNIRLDQTRFKWLYHLYKNLNLIETSTYRLSVLTKILLINKQTKQN